MASHRSPVDAGADDGDPAPSASTDTMTEYCPQCAEATPHYVRIEIRTESSGLHAEFSREPYRVTVCSMCDHMEADRIATT